MILLTLVIFRNEDFEPRAEWPCRSDSPRPFRAGYRADWSLERKATYLIVSKSQNELSVRYLGSTCLSLNNSYRRGARFYDPRSIPDLASLPAFSSAALPEK